MKKQINITEIDNGFLVHWQGLATIIVDGKSQQQAVPHVEFCEMGTDVVDTVRSILEA